jgi:hypothetical protein
MPTREEDELARQARSLLAEGRAAEAERVWRILLGKHHVVDIEYDDWLRGAAECYRALRRHRECALIYLFLHYFDQARDYFPPQASRFEEALCLELEKKHAAAARLHAESGRPVMAAMSFERAADDRAARTMWERVERDPRMAGPSYERALVETNLGFCARRLGDQEAERRHLVEAQRILEEVADDFETAGERDRAFDCYQVLIELGRRSGSFENLAEGYLNCVRVMKEDNLKFYVLQYCEDFLQLALERREFHAAATLAREVAEYALRANMPYDRHYLARSAEIWERSAARNEEAGGPAELTENALVGAIDAWSQVGQFGRVGECYRRLAALELGEKKKRRYQLAAERCRAHSERPLEAPAFPETLRQPRAYTDVWYLDLVEWELDGEYQAVCATLIGNLEYPDAYRRRALGLLLEPGPTPADSGGWARVALKLGDLQLYPALRPLERLYERGDARVRAAVMRGLGQMFYKRSFGLLGRGLADPDAQVRDAAVEALRKLHFPHAFDLLVRIFRESTEERVRVVALESIGELGSVDAGEFLIGVVRHESDLLRRVGQRLLVRFENPEIVGIVRSYLENETGPARAALEQVLRQLRRPEGQRGG